MLRSGMAAMALAAIAAMAATGCNNTQTVDASSGAPRMMEPTPELVAQSRPPVPDLPVPVSFGLNEDRSRSFAAAGARYVDHVYAGRADKFSVGRFYKRQMPINRWTLVTDIFAQGSVTLDFEKEGERCHIVIDETNNLFHPTQITVQLFTSGRIDPAANDQRNASKR